MINRSSCDSYGNHPTERHSINNQNKAELDRVEGRVSRMGDESERAPAEAQVGTREVHKKYMRGGSWSKIVNLVSESK